MLSQLYIKNIAVIKEAAIDFSGGLNVFTGETGAGKSILIGAIGAVLGERTSKDLIRTGEKRAAVSALFQNLSPGVCAAAAELGFEAEKGGELLISREIAPDHNTCRINGMPATVSMLRALGQRLINVHGQQDNQMVASPDNHRKFVDSFGGLEEELFDYQKSYRALLEVNRDLDALSMDEAQKAQRIDLLSYQVNEISAAALKAGEEEELTARRKIMKNSEEISGSLFEARGLLLGGEEAGGVVGQLDGVSYSLQNAGRFLEGFSALAQSVKGFRYELDEIARQVRDASEAIEYDPQELEEIESRLDLIYKLKRKYGSTVEEMIAYGEKAKKELEEISSGEERIEQLKKRRGELSFEAEKKAGALSKKRERAADAFAKAVQKELSELDMPSVRLAVRCEPKELSLSGADGIEFLLSANPGEEPKPLSKIASGGEMSRVMLAIKNVISGKDDIGTLIFDEVDAGISGRAAQKVGAKLKEVSRDRQVVCVTHLAQVAAFGGRHLYISKEVLDGHTFTTVKPLDEEARVGELARIIGGENITELSLGAAREMLKLAQTGQTRG